MAQPKIGDTLIEYDFDVAEAVQSKILTNLQIMMLSTRYAIYMKTKAVEPIPENIALDRTYVCKMAELDGKMGLIQELLDEHKQAVREYSELNKATATVATELSGNLQQRAAAHLKTS